MQDVAFGFGAHTGIGHAGEVLRLARLADEAGLDLVSLSDHPYLAEHIDPYAAVGVVLGATRRLAGLVNVTNLPLRPAPVLARTATSLSALSGGRFVLGMGAGGLWDRIADMGVPPLTGGEAVEAFEEAMLLVRRLSGGGPPVTHVGKHYRVHRIEPAPVPAPQIWTGSNGPKSLAATGRVADGWIPGRAADWLSDRYRWSRPIIDEAAAAAGRDPRAVRDVYNLPGRITDHDLRATRSPDGRWVGGSPAQWVEELTGAVLDHHATGFILFPPGDELDDVTLGRWAHEIAPAVRAAIAATSVRHST